MIHLKSRGFYKDRGTYVGVKLPHKAGEIIVLEILGEQIPGKLRLVPHNEARTRGAPRDHGLRRGVVHHVIGLDEERGRGVRIHPSALHSSAKIRAKFRNVNRSAIASSKVRQRSSFSSRRPRSS